LGTLEKCTKHLPVACAFYISLVFSDACHVLSQCNTGLGLLYLFSGIIVDGKQVLSTLVLLQRKVK